MRLKPEDGDVCSREQIILPSTNKSLEVQLVLSLAIGATAFFTFCILRPRWPALYAARKRQLNPKIGLPSLPDTAFGWMPKLYKVTEEQVLASAGLDAFVFLTFFKMAARLFAILAFFATVVLLPINRVFRDFTFDFGGNDPKHGNETTGMHGFFDLQRQSVLYSGPDLTGGKKDKKGDEYLGYLWSYVVFTYFFVGLTIYFVNWETFRIIRYRQDYLGSQSTVTDRTFRLTGIPSDLRSEDRIKHLIEKLGIGIVDSVTVCRKWEELDKLVELRKEVLRKLEVEWAKFLQNQKDHAKQNSTTTENGAAQTETDSAQTEQPADEEPGENGQFISSDQPDAGWEDHGRPKVNLRYGFFGMRSRQVDSIDYYEEKLRRVDDTVMEARKKEYPPTDMALVTMDSVASCQLVIQSRIDPRPGSLLTKPTPAPSDLVWRNTYAPRGVRRLKSWAVTIFITLLTLVWIFPTAFLASLLSICTLRTWIPQFVDWLQNHTIIYSLFQNGVPALVVSLLNVAVPYLYDWLSNRQGIISRGDVELSLISKNFFFTFFNTFFVFVVSNTGFDVWSEMQNLLKDTSQIPTFIAGAVENLSIFYISFIMLQGIGLMPFRILEAGSVVLYPIQHLLAKTPRDRQELKTPPVFQYGFYLPTSLLVFNLCIIYSVLRYGFAILITGTLYFVLGYFTFKYMLLYAMDQSQHATGGAWRIICYRIIIGLLVFEVVMIGQLSTQTAWWQSVFVVPLLPFTVWYSYYIKQRFEPLTKYIALRAIRADEDPEDAAAMDDTFQDEEGPRPSQGILRRGSTIDEYKEKGVVFINPSLVVPLQQPWIYQDPPPLPTDNETESTRSDPPILRGADSTLGIGDANVWMESGDNNV